jgi:hypothetical protein
MMSHAQHRLQTAAGYATVLSILPRVTVGVSDNSEKYLQLGDVIVQIMDDHSDFPLNGTLNVGFGNYWRCMMG